ncbi:hypothetical protein ACA910_002769 [Epithemia clementina (nom. ined.)]
MEPPTESWQIQCINHGVEGSIQLPFGGQCHHQAWMELVTKQKQYNFMKLSNNRDEECNFVNKVQELAEHYVRERQELSTEEEDNTTESEDDVSKAQPAKPNCKSEKDDNSSTENDDDPPPLCSRKLKRTDSDDDNESDDSKYMDEDSSCHINTEKELAEFTSDLDREENSSSGLDNSESSLDSSYKTESTSNHIETGFEL